MTSDDLMAIYLKLMNENTSKDTDYGEGYYDGVMDFFYEMKGVLECRKTKTARG